MKALLYELIGKLFFFIFHTHKGLKKKPHPKKMKPSMKEKKKNQFYHPQQYPDFFHN